MTKQTTEHATPTKTPDAEGAPESAGAQPPVAPADRVAELEALCNEYKDKMLRAQAECANISKRLHQQHAESIKLAGMGLARSLLSVIDNFDRTLASLKEAHADDPVIAGVKLIADQFTKIMKDNGVEPIEALGRPFDPNLHEALLHDRQSSCPPGTVTQEFERGYRMHDRVLRHAKVAVAAEPETNSTDAERNHADV